MAGPWRSQCMVKRSLAPLRVGLQGYAFQQLGDDQSWGIKVGPDGNKEREFAFGPQVRYGIGVGGFVLRFLRMVAVLNRASGDRIWFQFTIPLVAPRHAGE